ncbi:glyoxalase/bleomycin resistance protein/dioxygenase [Nesterenkonia sp. F]|uniref:glyoxalase/bleomycin resistance protein/dioxygenase n=1 Tax=Nesterenkonia sp. F TaxID=795955 RepID=UPI000255D000|nr:glyoxalase/bleomycin resistance protein/dioxygenase [Nesterenkonia sp. F]
MSLRLDAVRPAAESADGPAVLMSQVVERPGEVDALLDAAARDGAQVVRPGKRGLFGGYHASHRAPDGVVWKLSATSKRRRDPVADPPTIRETIAIAGVSAPTRAKEFYLAMGMVTDRDYGDTFVDFSLEESRHRLGMMPPRAIAKDVGVSADELGGAVVLVHRAGTRAEAEEVLAAARAAGARDRASVSVDGDETVGAFTDPSGLSWAVTVS